MKALPHRVDRRAFIGSAAAVMAGLPCSLQAAPSQRPSLARVIIDNDFAGDPDGLFQLAHHLLSPSVHIPIIVSSHLPPMFGGASSAADGLAKAKQLLAVLKTARTPHMLTGSESSIASRDAWKPSPATAAIIREAMREDRNEPLVYAAGAGLTELALAWLAEPRIGRRLKLVWIGGREHSGIAYPPPGPDEAEFNFSIDPLAAQLIFNESDIEIWQVPRDAYRQLLFSSAEMQDLATSGPLGRFLKLQMDDMASKLAAIPAFSGMPSTEVHVLGDSPLVTLTALLAPVHPDPSSSRYILQPTPSLSSDGAYVDRPDGRLMRVYTSIDAGLTIRDMVHKFRRPEAHREH